MDWTKLTNRIAAFAAGVWLAAAAGAGIGTAGPLLDRLTAALFAAGCFGVLSLLPAAFPAAEGPCGVLLAVFEAASVPLALLAARAIGGGETAVSIAGPGGLVLSSVVVGAVMTCGAPTLGLALLATGGLWLIQALPGAHQNGAAWPTTLAVLAVLGVLCSVGGPNVLPWDGPPALLLPFGLYALRLIAVTWLGSFMAAPLGFDDVWWFLLAVVMLTVVTAPAWITEQVLREQRLEEQLWAEARARQAQQQAIMDLTMLSARSAAFWADQARRRHGR